MFYRSLAFLVMALHFGYLVFLAVGGYVAWRWPRTLPLHASAAAWAVVITATSAPCPLTWLQNLLRTRAGQPELDGGFIDSYARGVLFPADHETSAKVVLCLAIVLSWFGMAQRSGRVSRARDARLAREHGCPTWWTAGRWPSCR